MRIKYTLFVLIIVGLLLITGCGKEEETPSAALSPLETPVSVASPVSTPMRPVASLGLEPRIMFSSDRDGERRLYTMASDGTDVQPLDALNALAPKALGWISELQSFTALLSLDGQEDFYLIDVHGNVTQRLTTYPVDKNALMYSAVVEKFVFLCVQVDLDICTVPLIGGEVVNLTKTPVREFDPSWSPSDGRILFISNRSGISDVWVMNHDGSGMKNLTHTGQPNAAPSWSPDGRQILFTSQRDLNWEVYVMDADGKNPVNLTNNPHRDMTPRWSPDGKHIAFRSDRSGDDELYVIAPDGSGLANVTNLPGSEEYVFSWSPDGERILFVSDANGNYEIYGVNPDGQGLVNLTQHPASDTAPQWIYH
jgi:TolB protein